MVHHTQFALALHLLVLVACQCQTASKEAAEEASVSAESQRGVVIRDGRVVRRSTFYLDADGWTVTGRDVKGPYTCHKMLCAEDHGHLAWHWSAPARFLAALSRAHGGRLVIRRGFFEIVKAGETAFAKSMPFDVSIESSSSGMKVQQFGLVKFGEFACEHNLELDVTGNWAMESGHPVDDSTLRHVLSTAGRMLIRGGYYRGNETAYLTSVEIVEPRSVEAGEQGSGGGETVLLEGQECGVAEGQCPGGLRRTGGQLSREAQGVGTGRDAQASLDMGALERALQERDAGLKAPPTHVSARPGAGFSTQVGTRESSPGSKRGGTFASAGQRADSERARKQQVEAEMQARRLGRSVSRDARRADASEDAMAPPSAPRASHETGKFETTWEEEESRDAEPNLLSCVASRGGVSSSSEYSQPMGDLLRAAADRGLPLNACLSGTTAAFGLATGAVVYVAYGDAPQILPLHQIESVSTDSEGSIVFLGAQGASGDGDGGMQSVLLRGCQMSAFDLDAMTSFFERVQQVVADLEGGGAGT